MHEKSAGQIDDFSPNAWIEGTSLHRTIGSFFVERMAFEVILIHINFYLLDLILLRSSVRGFPVITQIGFWWVSRRFINSSLS